MTLVHATSMVIGIIVGASIFIQPSEITRLVPSTLGLMMVWLAAGALTLCGALVCAELSAVFPDTGGVYVFLKKIFSPALGFLWGWGMFWSVHSGIIAAIAVILARYAGYFAPLGENGVRAVAVVAILGLSFLNYMGVKQGSLVQVVLTTAKLVAVAAMILLIFIAGGTARRGLPPSPAPSEIPIIDYGLAIAAGLFAFGGWHMVTYSAGETHDPKRNIPRALLIGVLAVTGIYMLLNAAYIYVLPLSQVATSTHIAADATERVLGTRAGGAIAVLVICSALGALNGIILAGPRVYYAMAQDGLAFHWLASVDTKRQTPHLAIAAQSIWSCVLVVTNSYRELFSRVVYTEWLFFSLLAAGLLVLRQRGGYQPRFLARGYTVVAVVFILASLGIVLNQVRANPRGSALGLGLILLGLPVYFVWSHQPSRKAAPDAHH
jgi:basic amino acid/polyamine antiporter, APA family